MDTQLEKKKPQNKKSMLKKMATASIFDSPDDVLDLPQRQIITYDDDLFTFCDDASSSSAHDEIDAVAENLNITVTIDNIGHEHRKRKRFVDDDDDDSDEVADDNFYHEPKKKRISYVPSCSSNATTSSRNVSAKSRPQPNEIHTTAKQSKTEPYSLLNMIGQGTYGQVWRGKCNSTQTVCAIKRLTCKLNTPKTKTELDFIKREYEHLMEMQDCENVVHLYLGRENQVSRNDLEIDLIFEYCPYDLKKLILNRRVNFRLNEIKSFMRQILLGLSEIHSKLIMHRDFKTENILLTKNGVVKIADFGLSRKMIDPSTSFERVHYTSEVVTQWYRAPEILLGQTQYNERIDMWSMGCIMGEFWQRAAILPGTNEIEQIRMISDLCGSMTPENWPNIVNLRVYQNILQLPKSMRRTRYFLKDKSPLVTDDQANHFFDKLMICNPDKRLNAAQALNDEFFYIEPLPVKNLVNFMSRNISNIRV